MKKYLMIIGLVGVLCSFVYSQSTTYYVDSSKEDDSGVGTSWATAKQTIQAAVDLTVDDDIVLVTNGVYSTGTKVTPGSISRNRVVVTHNIVVTSVNGPEVTVIEGAPASGGNVGSDAVRCVYMNNGILSGFTLTNGYTMASGDTGYDLSGGGIDMIGGNAAITNCRVVGCVAKFMGGGIAYGNANSCLIAGNLSQDGGGGVASVTISDSVISNNTSSSASSYGGGCHDSTLDGCVLTGNSAAYGGGSYRSELTDCILSSNLAANYGGGSYFGTLSDCRLESNRADWGGGSMAATHNRCVFSGNTAVRYGGGSGSDMVLNNCLLIGNSAGQYGGGASDSELYNCTLYGNTAGLYGAGSRGGTLKNCVIWSNTVSGAVNNWANGTIENSCTIPLPTGIGNITNNPMFVATDDLHLMSSSPCIDAGNDANAPLPYDLGGTNRIQGLAVDIGAYESIPVITRIVRLGGNLSFGNITVGSNTNSTLSIYNDGNRALSISSISYPAGFSGNWNSGIIIAGGTQNVTVVFSPTAEINYGGILTVSSDATSGTNTYAVSGIGTINHPATFYVDAARADDSGSGIGWATAKRTIQAALDLTIDGDTVLVTNGTYNSGGEVLAWMGLNLMNRVVITNDITLKSVNGSDVTFITGEPGSNGSNDVDAVRCVYMENGSEIIGFGIKNGYTRASGGTPDTSGAGIMAMGYCVVSNCFVEDNHASYNGGGVWLASSAHMYNSVVAGNTAGNFGGGIGGYGGLINNSLIVENCAYADGGGVQYGTLKNCTIYGNQAGRWGGGASGATMYNCIVWSNTATASGNDIDAGIIRYTCASDGLTAGVNGCITNNPLFVDPTNYNYRLLIGSPCINAGTNDFAALPADFADNDRIIEQIVDMGAYEYVPLWMPTDNIVVNNRKPAFQWPATTGATWYQIWIGRNGKKYLSKWVNNTTTWTSPDDMEAGNYSWYIRAWGPVIGIQPWSAEQTFTILSNPPDRPVLQTPAGAQADRMPLFDWDSNGQAVWYQLYINKDNKKYLSKWINQTATEWTPSQEFDNGEYEWWLRGWNVDGMGSWSSGNEFNYGVLIPVIPIEGSTVSTNGVAVWNDAASGNADWYQIWLGRNGAPYSNKWYLRNEVLDGSSLKLDYNLPAGNYSWWLRGWSSAYGMGPWVGRNFTVTN